MHVMCSHEPDLKICYTDYLVHANMFIDLLAGSSNPSAGIHTAPKR